MFQHILVATDGSLLSEAAVDNAMSLARDAGAKVTAVTVTEPFHVMAADSKQLSDTKEAYDRHVKAEAARYIASAECKAKALGVQCRVVQIESEQPYKAIIETAKASGCDLIALVLGSVTNKVLTHSSIPVLVYR